MMKAFGRIIFGDGDSKFSSRRADLLSRIVEVFPLFVYPFVLSFSKGAYCDGKAE